MTEIDNINEFPKLNPDKSVRFEFKDSLKRSSESGFNCSKTEYQHITAAENEDLDTVNANKLIEEYKKLRLKPDMELVMPNKNLLKHTTNKTKSILLWISSAAAVIIIFLLLMPKSKTIDTIQGSIENTNTESIIVKDNTEKLPTIITPKKEETKIAENSLVVKPKITDNTNIEQQKIENVENIEKIEEEEPLPDIRTNNLHLATIQHSTPFIENKQKQITVMAYELPDSKNRLLLANLSVVPMKEIINNTKEVINNTNTAKNIKAFIGNKDNETILAGFKLTNIINKLNSDSKTDKYIEEWIKNNKDIPFEIFANYPDDSKITEIYDTEGNLVKAIFFTKKPVHIKNE